MGIIGGEPKNWVFCHSRLAAAGMIMALLALRRQLAAFLFSSSSCIFSCYMVPLHRSNRHRIVRTQAHMKHYLSLSSQPERQVRRNLHMLN